MNTMKNKIEILAPAGSYESLQAAINAKADSIYFGVTQLNMRAKSSANFDLNDLTKIIEICHKNNVKAYLTLNTLLYDHDLKIMQLILNRAKEASVDAVILADTASIVYAKKIELTIHISVQLSISNVESIKFWAAYADVIVLARELDLKMIKHISQEIKSQNIVGPSGNLIKIEAFAHGAICIAVSGRCGMSLYSSNSSANRGACIQNCRKPYVVTDKESGIELEIDSEYIMSPNDICTLPFLDDFINSGVQILKFEGRGRAADYVDMVIKTYRMALSSIENNTFAQNKEQKVKGWMADLKKVYNRGFSDGYYLGVPQGWSKVPGSQATEEKIFIGKVIHYYPKPKIMQVEVMAHPLSIKDKMIITGETTGVIRDTVLELQSEEDTSVDVAIQKTKVTLPISQLVRRNDKVYIVKEIRITD